MALLLSFAFIALAFGVIDSAPNPEIAYFNINPFGGVQGFAEPDIFDEVSPLVNAGYNFELYGEPYLFNKINELGEDVAGFPARVFGGGASPLDALGGLDGGLGGIIGGGSGGILDGGSGGILEGGSGGILDGGYGGILDGGSGGILDGIAGGIPGAGSGGILDNIPVGVGSSDYSSGGILEGSGGILGNYDGSDYGFDSESGRESASEVPGSNIDAYTFDYTGSSDSNSTSGSGVPGSSTDPSDSGSGSGVPGSNTDPSDSDSGSGSEVPGSNTDADTYDYSGPSGSANATSGATGSE